MPVKDGFNRLLKKEAFYQNILNIDALAALNPKS